MIIIAELAFNDGGHAPFNAGLLAVVRKAFPEQQVFFFGGPAHIEELKKQIGAVGTEAIEWREMNLISQGITYFPRLIGEMKSIRILLQMFPEGNAGPLILTSARPATLLALKWVKRGRLKTIRAQVVLHGHLSGVTGKRYRHPVRRFQDMRTALTLFANVNVQYLVLEEHLRNVLVKHLPCLSSKIEVLNHPLPPNEVELKTIPFAYPVRFGFLGLANAAKGFPTFVTLAEGITENFRGKAEFHVFGRLSSEEKPTVQLDALTTKPGVERLSRLDYIRGVEGLHFIVFPHQSYLYELNSSGTLLDALAWGKPMIARKIALFEDFFATHGDMGYLFSTDRELKIIVEQIIKRADKAYYGEQVRNVRKTRCSRTPETLAVNYRKICEKTGTPI